MGNALISYGTYIGEFIRAGRSRCFLPDARFLSPWQLIGSVLLLSAATTAVVAAAKRQPYLCVGWLLFMATLVPVIGVMTAWSALTLVDYVLRVELYKRGLVYRR
jgi:hypothetical protein